MFFVPDSPRWLADHGKIEESRKALEWFRPSKEEVDKELTEIMIAIEEEKQMAQSTSFLDMFTNPIDRRRTMLAVAGVSVQAACGAMFMLGN